jgi:Spy/CpxP family protein refolding chaperone
MKHVVFWSGVVLIVVGVTIAIARADSPMRRRWCHRGPLGYLAHELNLNDVQRSQIKSIWQAEKPTIAALVREFSAENKEMDAVTTQGKSNEAKVQEIANRQGMTTAKLLVEKQKVKSQIYSTVLTPDQRTKADSLQERWHSRLDRIADRLENSYIRENH